MDFNRMAFNGRKLGVLALAVLLVIALATVPVLAQDAGVTQQTQLDAEVRAQLPEPGLLPDSPFYFVKSLFERIQLFFKFGAEARAEFLAELMDRRSAEMAEASSQGNEQAAERSAQSQARLSQQAYVQLGDAFARADVEAEPSASLQAAFMAVTDATARAQHVLLVLLAELPAEAHVGLETALEAQLNGQQHALEVLADVTADGQAHAGFAQLLGALEARLNIGLEAVGALSINVNGNMPGLLAP